MNYLGASQQTPGGPKALKTRFQQSPLSFASQSLESDFLVAQRESFNRRCRLCMVVIGSVMIVVWIRALQNQNVVFQAWNAVYLLGMALCLLLLHRSSKSDMSGWGCTAVACTQPRRFMAVVVPVHL
jgi:hypothetical protein